MSEEIHYAISPQWLKRMRTTKPDFLLRLFDVFLTEEPLRLADLGQAIASSDLEKVRYLAHSLKGASATMGADRVRDCCRELEMAAIAPQQTELLPLFQRLEQEMEHVYSVMRASIENPTPK